eukprot:scaffold1909_cov130-Cylindrotheca_fusiformis.AAC.12
MRPAFKLFHLILIVSSLFFTHALVTPRSLSTPRKPALQHQLSLVVPEGELSSSVAMSFTPLPDSTVFAECLGYLIGAGSLLLYTPIAFRLARQKSAEGLVVSTWWLKVTSYTASDVYAFTHGYPISAYLETLIITLEAAVVLGQVVYFQRRADEKFWYTVAAYSTTSLFLLFAAPAGIVALGQVASAILNTGALIPQFLLNNERQKAGDYSPVTAGLAAGGCFARVFTTIQLANSDSLLLASYGLAFLLNSALFGQIVYLGTQVEGRSLRDVLTADAGTASAVDQLVIQSNAELTAYQMIEESTLDPLQEDLPDDEGTPSRNRSTSEDDPPLSR